MSSTAPASTMEAQLLAAGRASNTTSYSSVATYSLMHVKGVKDVYTATSSRDQRSLTILSGNHGTQFAAL